MGQILRHLEAQQIVERVKPFATPSLRSLYRRANKAALVPILNLAERNAGDPAGFLAVVGFHRKAGMKTRVVSTLNGRSNNVNKFVLPLTIAKTCGEH